MFYFKSLLTFLILLVLTTNVSWALIPKAVLFNQGTSSNISVQYADIYKFKKYVVVPANGKFTVLFNENVYQPTLIHFLPIIPRKGRPLSQFLAPGQTILEQPVLVVLPGDSIAVRYDENQNTFEFTGRNQIELDFYKKIWQNRLSLSWYYLEMNVADTKVPLDQFLKHWYQLKLEGEAMIAELEHTPGVRPQIAAFLARQIRLRIFTFLTLPASYQQPRDSLRVFTKAYIDSVAVGARILSEFKNAPATSTAGFIQALSAYVAYRCVQLGRYPTYNEKYALAKREYNGFQRAWLCFNILETDGQRSHKNISWLLQDYQRWVQPYGEFVRVLKGDPTVPLRSYKGVVFADSLINVAAQSQRLTELLARYKGQVVLLDLWASWCRPCIEEMPTSVAVSNKYGSKGLVVLFLSIDKDLASWRQGLKHLPKGTRNHFRFADPATSVFLKELEVTSVPRYVLIDRNGLVRYPDALRPSDPRLEAILEKMLAL